MRRILTFLFLITASMIPLTAEELKLHHALGDSGDRLCDTWVASVDYLNWKARRSGMDYAIVDPNTDNNIEGIIESMEFDNEGGIRASIGKRLACGWDTAATYTGYNTDDYRTLSAPAGGQLWLTRTNPASFNNAAASAVAQASLDYDVVDLEAGYWFHPNDVISFRVFGGSRGAWTRQATQIDYTGGTVTGTRTQIQRSRMNGFGFRAGGMAHWRMGCALSLFGSASASALVGDFEIEAIESEGIASGNVSATSSFYDAVPNLELATGIDLTLRNVSLQTGYEFSSWMNLDQRMNFTGSSTIGRGNLGPSARDLILDGVFLRLVYTR